MDVVRVIAHRGASYGAPEHSLQAYLDAIEQGADGVECDVRLTADGHLVCVHDPTVRGLTGARGRVSSMTLAQLQRLDWPGGSGPLTLRDLFELVFEAGRCPDTGQWMEITVETKHPTRFGAQVEEAVCDLADWFGWLPDPGGRATPVTPLTVMSFSAAALRRVRRRNPAVPRVYLLDQANPAATRPVLPGHALDAGISIALVHEAPEWVQAIRAAGHGISVWTVNTPEDADAAVAAGASRIITDRPQAMLLHLQHLASAQDPLH